VRKAASEPRVLQAPCWTLSTFCSYDAAYPPTIEDSPSAVSMAMRCPKSSTSSPGTRLSGIAPLDFLACYEMPAAIVSSEPDLCLQAMLALVMVAERLLAERSIAGKDALVIGLNVGSYPATYLANRIGVRLCAVASADRADLAIWESPAACARRWRGLSSATT